MSAKNKFLKNGLTNKQRILQMVEQWDEDVSFEDAAYRMFVMKEVMQGIKESEAGLGIDHDEVFDELERLCDEEEKQAHLDAECLRTCRIFVAESFRPEPQERQRPTSSV